MDQALSPEFAPFTFALGLMLAILGLELVALMLGLSLHGSDGDLELGADMVALHANFDLAPDATPDLDHLLQVSDSLDAPPETAVDAGLLGVLGLGRVPLMIWLAAMLFSFGLGGYLLQGVAAAIAAPLPALIAVPVTLIGALSFSRAILPRLRPADSVAGNHRHLNPVPRRVARGCQPRHRPRRLRR